MYSLNGHLAPPIFIIKRMLASALRNSDSYRTVHISCNKCSTLLFKYKKKNGTKSALVKMYTARIIYDPHSFVELPPTGLRPKPTVSTAVTSPAKVDGTSTEGSESTKQAKKLECPQCLSEWGRHGVKAGHTTFKCIGGKIRMS